MKFFLKILNETKSRRYLKVDGSSGVRYLFEYNGFLRAYTYQPKSQDEVDDLFKTMGRTTAYIFCPVSHETNDKAKFTLEEARALIANEAPPAETVTSTGPAPEVQPTVSSLSDSLVEQCLHRGLTPAPGDSDEFAARLVEAYDKGATDTINSMPKRKASSRKAKPAAPA